MRDAMRSTMLAGLYSVVLGACSPVHPPAGPPPGQRPNSVRVLECERVPGIQLPTADTVPRPDRVTFVGEKVQTARGHQLRVRPFEFLLKKFYRYDLPDPLIGAGFKESGTEFERLATITLSYKGCKVTSPDDLEVVKIRRTESGIEIVQRFGKPEHNPADSTLTIVIDSLSEYAAAEP